MHSISIHPIEHRLVTTSISEAILYDTSAAPWSKMNVLVGPNNASFNQVGFSPTLGDYLIAAFDDNSMVIWDSVSMAQLWRVDASAGNTASGTIPTGCKCFAVSQDEDLIATGGWNAVQIWNLKSRVIVREVTDASLLDGIAAVQFLGLSRVTCA